MGTFWLLISDDDCGGDSGCTGVAKNSTVMERDEEAGGDAE